ncbi:OST-HTH/LOTUS domain-containing protein [Branchiibius hedensis]|uniref:OST-HTH/LOTUS domain-containing protein n=1 Tax=Branchiibius hedensis TaxID=672460 RepID=A0A2Y9C2A3_9MICO|nr:NYN domain-containing protein [Branchiibius hedensis]PWJ26942.1 OST-HTH/LOTUS domain-containing protein [Branchiibius hedensis]SSA35753.1 OST-HTH/LOTUS domain-containing protein [Branchiibius hedensis]
MPEPSAAVAVYIDFDNVVISRYDQVHGKGSFWRDRDKGFDAARLAAAEVDLHAILDFASSYGRLALTRAYADWSVPANVHYRKQLVDRAVDLIQLFPASGSKNGADIRLAVDALEDMGQMPSVATVVLVAGDSDYIPLAQRLKRMGRYVVAVGVAGATSRSLAAAVDELVTYDNLPGLSDRDADEVEEPPAKKRSSVKSTPTKDEEDKDTGQLSSRQATRLLLRALRILREKDPDAEWFNAGEVKSQMKRMDPSFNEKDFGVTSFSEFIKTRSSIAELEEDHHSRTVRLRPGH